MATLTKVSEEYTLHNQSWHFNGIYRHDTNQLHVEIRRNAYSDQSHAKVSMWTVGGWNFYVALPVEQWWSVLPSYGRKELTPENESAFLAVRDALLAKFALGWWGVHEVAIKGEGV